MVAALELAKPMVIHSRGADADSFDLMTRLLPSDYKIHLHCFTSPPQWIEKWLTKFSNLYVGFTGCSTFSGAHDVRDAISRVPLERLLIETDGPFMAPEPLRGSTAHSGMIPFIAQKFAEIKGTSIEKMYQQTKKNAQTMYGIPD
eukprot:TRINITY_DN2133_c0_g2_i4.p1 TRINITY_DN2133_c0_g2~~TRINITY_DN2133_c0_g2_i4.p1  ORF type:complete len:145 (+),score=27.32 TRINITY_DN2133_c0_g2_i4:504-938(+)